MARKRRSINTPRLPDFPNYSAEEGKRKGFGKNNGEKRG